MQEKEDADDLGPMTPFAREIHRLMALNETNANRLSNIGDPRLKRSTLYRLVNARRMEQPPQEDFLQALAAHLRGTSVRALRLKVAESIQLLDPEPQAMAPELRGLTPQQIEALRQVALAMHGEQSQDEQIHRATRRPSTTRANDESRRGT